MKLTVVLEAAGNGCCRVQVPHRRPMQWGGGGPHSDGRGLDRRGTCGWVRSAAPRQMWPRSETADHPKALQFRIP